MGFVASPFYVRPAIRRSSRSTTLTDAARTLGAGPGRMFGRIGLPLAVGGLLAGGVLSFARGVGEFGATIMFAGNVQGVTQTLTLTIYEEFEANLDVAIALGVLLVVLAAGCCSRQAHPSMDTLGLDFTVRPSLVRARLSARARFGDGRARRPLRRRQDDGPAGGRRPRAGARGTVACDGEVWLGPGVELGPRSARSACSSRTTRSSRT